MKTGRFRLECEALLDFGERRVMELSLFLRIETVHRRARAVKASMSGSLSESSSELSFESDNAVRYEGRIRMP